MKIRQLIICLLICFTNAFGQVGIGTTTPDVTSILDVSSTDSGILVPRISLIDINNTTLNGINTAATGLLIWNTNAAILGGNGVGFYFFNGTVWIPVKETIYPDADWHEIGTTASPDAITDNIFSLGNVAIGKNTIGTDTKVDIDNNDKTSSLTLLNSFDELSTTSNKYGINNTINSTEYQTGLQNNLMGNGNFKTGVDNLFSGSMNNLGVGLSTDFTVTGSGNQFGVYNNFRSTSSSGAIWGMRNWFQSGASYSGILNGIVNDFNNNNNGFNYGVTNNFTGTGSGAKYAIKNIFSGISTATFYGLENDISATGNGMHYGVYNNLSGTGLGNKFGIWTTIQPTAGGIHYGIYSNVTKANSYAGYFQGRVSIGTTGVNNYILPSSRGLNGQIIQTDGLGNLTWQNLNAWLLNGNAGTNPAINFIGTTDDNDIVFKRNNILFGKLTSNNVSFGQNALFNNTIGVNNLANGNFALLSNTTGNNNVAIGSYSLNSSTIGSNNTAIGTTSLFSNLAGYGNSANGQEALYSNINGFQNTANGYRALFNNNSGNNNTGIGHFADVAIGNLSNATALGAKAYVTTSNSMVLGSINGVNGATSSVNVGIGTTAPSDKLHVVGNIRMVDGNQSTGKILTSDANGTATWQNASANAWGLVGNAGTNPLTNFIGTTDDNDLIFKRFNVNAGRIRTLNTAFGKNSLSSITTGIWNVAIGDDALSFNTTGHRNTSVGSGALNLNTDGYANTAIGTATLTSNTIGDYNTGIGSSSLGNNTIGSYNTTIGYQSLTTNITGNWNTAIGANSLFINTSSNNTAIGKDALLFTTTGNGNTAVGIGSFSYNSTGDFNTAIGSWTAISSLNLTNATAIGHKAYVSTSNSMVLGSVIGENGAASSVNVGIGTTSPLDRLHIVGNIRMVDGNQTTGKILTSDANGTATWQNASANAWGLFGNAGTNPTTNFIGTTDDSDLVFKRFNVNAGRVGINNSAFGASSLDSNTTGVANTAIGQGSLTTNTSGLGNTANGFQTLFSNSIGNYNTAIGYRSLYANTNGTNNTANGFRALDSNTTGDNNTAIGSSALSLLTTGSNNIAVGNNAQVPSATLSNQVRIGNTAITYAGVQVAWTITSDQRWKSGIKPSPLGLEFIKKLNPVSYYRNNDENKKTEYGFVAQEVENTLIECGDSNNGIIKKDDEGMLGLRYNDLIAPMVKASQELNSKIETLEKENTAQKELINQLIKRIESLEKK
ncbi:tail fiber domain-containing protein [Flavobacterium sp.]|uniref:tail fiber domain-containing protein n=1 Tax=Flavobacterium sp. TaxID=239 RepID=UPI0025BB7AE6|nr:tail fiber domain-containing protein [Flavobacterium sp.]MBA4155293.1 hypothetical protein [Flavobacterium sp.]